MRSLLYVTAALILSGIVAGVVLWFGQHGDPVTAFTHFWTVLRSDWMLVVIVVDMLVFTTVAFVWVAMDLRGRGASVPVIVGWLGTMLFLGSAVLLFYLARRSGSRIGLPEPA